MMSQVGLIGTARRLVCIAAGIALCASAHASLSVRVDASKGAPRLMVNGKPERARIFWGGPGSSTIQLTRDARLVEFDFTPSASTQTGTMHFRFGKTPGGINLDDIRVTDLTSGKDTMPSRDFEGGIADFDRDWRVWPQGEQNTVGRIKVEKGAGRDGSTGVRIDVTPPPGGVWPDFHVYHEANLAFVQGHRYRVSFWTKAEPERDVTVSFYIPGATFTYIGGPPGHFESEIRLAASAGVNLVSFQIPLPWPAPGEGEDWNGVDSACEQVLRVNPKALLLPRICVYAPAWWLNAHPDDLMRWEDGSDPKIESPASTAFRRDASARLGLLVEHLERKYGEHMAGYHPVGQNTGEWFYMNSWENPLNGYSPCDVAAFRAWLRRRYGTVDALRTAWHDRKVDFDTASVPSPAARHAAPDGIFRDPIAERPIVDFVRFQQDSMAGCVCDLAKVVRQATHGRKLVVFFYGYLFEFGIMPTGSGSAGHYALRRVLDSPDIDVLCSPISYTDRGPGMSAPCMTAAESVALAGKMWLNEDDTRTHLTKENDFPGTEFVVNNLDETNGELVRNVAQEAMRNFATWWMDLPCTGWFDDPGMWAEMARLRSLDEPLMTHPTPFRPEIAAVIDEQSMTRLAQGGAVVGAPCAYYSRAVMGRSGAPYGQYLLDDVAAGRVHSKLYVFTSAWCVSAETRARLLKSIAGSVRIWCYAPGYFDDFRKSPESMRRLTGFDLKPVTPGNAWATPTALGRKRGLTRSFGVESAIHPLFAATDARPGEILATYPDGSAAVAVRGKSIFVGAPGLSTDLVRLAARLAGTHLFTDVECNVYGNGPFLALHAPRDGPVTIDTGRTDPVTDLLTGRTIGTGPKLRLTMKRGRTRVLRIGRD